MRGDTFFAKILTNTYGENDSGSNQSGRKSHKFCSPISRLKNTNTSLIKLGAAPLVEMPMREHLSPSNHRRHLHLLTVQYLITREKTFGYFNTSSSVYCIRKNLDFCQLGNPVPQTPTHIQSIGRRSVVPWLTKQPLTNNAFSDH